MTFHRRRTLAFVLVSASVLLGACDQDKVPAIATPSVTTPVEKVREEAPLTYATLNRYSGFSTGKSASAMSLPTAYVLFDPQCPHCAELWDTAEQLSGRVRIKWIPVAIMGPRSQAQAGALLEDFEPVALMQQMKAALLNGEAPPSTRPALKPETVEQVQHNTELLKRLGTTSVPLIVYQNASGSMQTTTGALPLRELEHLLAR